jgi:Ca2+-binding RTX toxin-like protein
VVSATADGRIVVNGGQMAISGGPPTVATTVRIELNGLGGDDHLALDESGGGLPRALILGGAGADFLVGGSGNDTARAASARTC